MKKKKVFSLNELLTPELSKELGLPSLSKSSEDSSYFFDNKDVNQFWDEGLIKIYVYSVTFDGDALIFDTRITIDTKEFDIFIIVDFEETVEFGSEQGSDFIEEFEISIENEIDYFKEIVEDIYNELIPVDFWDVKSRLN